MSDTQLATCLTDCVVWCRKIVPSLHRRYIESMVGMFGESAEHCIANMRPAATGGLTVDMENYYSRLALDIIGKARPPAPCCTMSISDGLV